MIERHVAGFVIFAGAVRLARGDLAAVTVVARRALDHDPAASVLVFDEGSGAVIDLDLRGAEDGRPGRPSSPPADHTPRRGRPRLGVVAREVTLLPRHWDWLARQKGGASVALRALVEAARKADLEAGPSPGRTDAAYRFMTAMAGDLPGYEEALRALFAGDRRRLEQQIDAWPIDVRREALRFAYGDEAGDAVATAEDPGCPP